MSNTLQIKQIYLPEEINDFNFFQEAQVQVEAEKPEVGEVGKIYSDFLDGQYKYYEWDDLKQEYTEIKFYLNSSNNYLLFENNIIPPSVYKEMNPLKRNNYIQKKSNSEYKVFNGVLKKINGDDEEFYSPNLILGKACYKIGINSLPGNKFMINDNPLNIIRISASGVFNMDFGNTPITSIRILDNNEYNLFGTTIDIIYLEREEGENG